MDSLKLYVGQTFTGVLTRDEGGVTFSYCEGYAGPPLFLNWPVARAARHWQCLPAELAGLLPEGMLWEQWQASGAIDVSDWALLAATGADLPGCISALPDTALSAPRGREAPGVLALERARIVPGEGALPYSRQALAGYTAAAGFTCALPCDASGAIYSRKDSAFKLVSANGSYLLTPEPKEAPESVENQLLTAQLAQDAGIAVPRIGRVRTTDGVAVLWAERFDRAGASNSVRLRVEHACQLLGRASNQKYDGTVEAVAGLVRQYCTNPQIQLMRLFQRVLFGWVTGNAGLNLKKWALIQNGPLIELSPAYELLNDALHAQEGAESALSIDGQHDGLDRNCLLEYLGQAVCGLNPRVIARVMTQLSAVPWEQRIQASGLSKDSQRAYYELLSERWLRLR